MENSENISLKSKAYNSLDMNSSEFNQERYMNKILKESRLSELMDTEQMLHKQIQTLDSEMQTLIYENYNKFISATETVRKMASHFDKMEYELNSLSEKMNIITEKSSKVANNLSAKRDELTLMSAKHQLLNKIQFILELPDKMSNLIKRNCLFQAIDNYLDVQHSLEKYSHLSSFKNIQLECNQMLDEIKHLLYQQISNETSPSQMNDCIKYLFKLNEPPSLLCDKYFEMCTKKLKVSLNEAKDQLECTNIMNQPTMDILAFIEHVCNHYLDNLDECIIFYKSCFSNDSENTAKEKDRIYEIDSKLKIFVNQIMEELFDIVLKRIKLEKKTSNNIIMFVRSLDRFYKRVQTLKNKNGQFDFSERGLQVIYESIKDQCDFLFESLISKFQEDLTNMKNDIKNEVSKTTSIARTNNLKNLKIVSNTLLSETLISFETTISEDLKSVLSKLDPFLFKEHSFINKEFERIFVENCVFTNIIEKYIHFILDNAKEYEHSYGTLHVSTYVILMLSKLCYDLSDSIIAYLFSYTEKLFHVPKSAIRNHEMITKKARTNAQKLLNIYVWIEGQSISQMIRKSVETRDWLINTEPRSVRSVMKRVIEDITVLDFLVGQLYEEGVRIERSSDSSRTFSAFSYRSRQMKSDWSYDASKFDNNIISNIQKIFNDKIEIYGKVEFCRLSVVTGVIKIVLKALIECVRLFTFSRYGFQQMQVDCYYLQTKLWKFAHDERIIINLIEEVIFSTKKRCIEQIGMEKSIIENICENI